MADEWPLDGFLSRDFQIVAKTCAAAGTDEAVEEKSMNVEIPRPVTRIVVAALLALSTFADCTPPGDTSGTRGSREIWDPDTTKTPPPPDADNTEDPGTGGSSGTSGSSGTTDPPDAAPQPSAVRPDAATRPASLDGPIAYSTPVVAGQGHACTLSFTVTTVTFKGSYAPENVGVIWIADAADKFVKTLHVWAGKRRKHLDTWLAASAGNTVDATTGASASSHAARTGTWNCTGVDEKVVPDGAYRVYAEFTESNSGGRTLMPAVNFTKNGTPVDVTPPDQGNFKAMHLGVMP